MATGYNDMIKLAECDYKASMALERDFPDEFAVRASVYHLQQAIEKMLKAIILFHGETPSFTHDIYNLAEHCKKLDESFSDKMEDVADTLTLWESKSRYDPYIAFNKNKYEKAKELYGELVTKVQKQQEEIVVGEQTDDPSDQSIKMKF